MRPTFRLLLFVFCVAPLIASAQVRAPAGREFQITKITKNLIATPNFRIGQYRSASNERWLEVEGEFNAAPEWRL